MILGDFRSDAIGFLDLLPGVSIEQATRIVDGAGKLVQERARVGALAAIKDRRVLAAAGTLAGMSILSLALSIVAIRRTRRR